MKSLNICIEKEDYKVVQPIDTINLYKIANSRGLFEITRNKHNGIWKVLIQSNLSVKLPIISIGKAIESQLGILN